MSLDFILGFCASFAGFAIAQLFLIYILDPLRKYRSIRLKIIEDLHFFRLHFDDPSLLNDSIFLKMKECFSTSSSKINALRFEIVFLSCLVPRPEQLAELIKSLDAIAAFPGNKPFVAVKDEIFKVKHILRTS